MFQKRYIQNGSLNETYFNSYEFSSDEMSKIVLKYMKVPISIH